MLKFTGHPLVDVGVATIWAFSRQPTLEQVTEKDLDKVADYIEAHYVVNPLSSFFSVAFTKNAWFNQNAYNPNQADLSAEEKKKRSKKRAELADAHLRQWREQSITTERDVFLDQPIIGVALSGKLMPGRAGRAQVPLTLGDEDINFYAKGESGLPISGLALLCLQALPLGCAKCGGKLLTVHSDNSELIYKFAKKFLDTNRLRIDLAEKAGDSKLPEAESSAKTLLAQTLIEIEQARQSEREARQPFSVTAYHFGNSGQGNPLDADNPPLEIYYLPLEITDFLAAIVGASYRAEWQKIEHRAWQLTKSETSKQKEEKKPQAKKSKKKVDTTDKRPRRNFLYEDLFHLPENAPTFIRRYFLRIPKQSKWEDDPRRQYSLKSDADLVSWKLTQLFLERILHMKPNRIERIREMGEQLAQYVHGENDTRFFGRFYSEQRNYSLIRNELIRVNHALLKRGQPPLVKFEPYMEVFEDVDERGRTDWRLARDLVLIRMIEKLYELRWIQQHPDAIPEPREETGDDNAQ